MSTRGGGAAVGRPPVAVATLGDGLDDGAEGQGGGGGVAPPEDDARSSRRANWMACATAGGQGVSFRRAGCHDPAVEEGFEQIVGGAVGCG